MLSKNICFLIGRVEANGCTVLIYIQNLHSFTKYIFLLHILSKEFTSILSSLASLWLVPFELSYNLNFCLFIQSRANATYDFV